MQTWQQDIHTVRIGSQLFAQKVCKDFLSILVPGGQIRLHRLQMSLWSNFRSFFWMKNGTSFGFFLLFGLLRSLAECGHGIGNQTGPWNERYFFPWNLTFLEQGNQSVTVRTNSRLMTGFKRKVVPFLSSSLQLVCYNQNNICIMRKKNQYYPVYKMEESLNIAIG